MLKVTPEIKVILDRSILSSTPFGEQFRFFLWDIFRPKKRDKLIEGLKYGKNWHCAYHDAKNL